MTLRGKSLSDAQRAEIAAAVKKNEPLRGWRHSNQRVSADLMDGPKCLKGTGREGRMKGSMK